MFLAPTTVDVSQAMQGTAEVIVTVSIKVKTKLLYSNLHRCHTIDFICLKFSTDALSSKEQYAF